MKTVRTVRDHNPKTFDYKLDQTLFAIQDKGGEVIDIKFNSSDSYYAALVIYIEGKKEK